MVLYHSLLHHFFTPTYIFSSGVERVIEYSQLPQEPAPPANPTPIPEHWPTEGKIEFVDVDVRYRPGLDPVLRNINCTIRPGEKVGIVGRTGAGKSTFTSAMFRLVDVTEGQILVDGVDIMNVSQPDS
jgi:ATP-binding cassette subfamily C (CFTR/MRP) protein 1